MAVCVRMLKPPHIGNNRRGVNPSHAAIPLDPVRFCPGPFKDRFPHCYPVPMNHKAEAIHGAARYFPSPAVLRLKSEYLPIFLKPEAELFPKIAGRLPHHLMELFLVSAKQKHIVRIPQVMVRSERLRNVVIKRRQQKMRKPRACIKAFREALGRGVDHAEKHGQIPSVPNFLPEHRFQYFRVYIVIESLYIQLRHIKAFSPIFIPPPFYCSFGKVRAAAF